MIIIQSHSIYNKIGDSGATSLSEALKVNSSLTQLNLRLSLWLNMINWLLLNHIPFITILVHQEQHQYQKYWRLIHHSINWTCMWVYNWIWLIDYYSVTFYLEQYWRFRKKVICRCSGIKHNNHKDRVLNWDGSVNNLSIIARRGSSRSIAGIRFLVFSAHIDSISGSAGR